MALPPEVDNKTPHQKAKLFFFPLKWILGTFLESYATMYKSVSLVFPQETVSIIENHAEFAYQTSNSKIKTIFFNCRASRPISFLPLISFICLISSLISHISAPFYFPLCNLRHFGGQGWGGVLGHVIPLPLWGPCSHSLLLTTCFLRRPLLASRPDQQSWFYASACVC